VRTYWGAELDYTPVTRALAEGADPGMLCETCPWDRLCLQPPAMSKADIDRHVADAERRDEENRAAAVRQGRPEPMPTGTLITALVLAARDQQATMCPVLALRFRSSGGKDIAGQLRAQMQGWDDQAA
jgi:hypothetical protein